MAFLRISGIAVPVMHGDAGHRPIQLGDNERAEDGSLLVNRRTIKETYHVTLAHQVPATAFAFRDLFLGKGHVWNFDSHLYSSKGLGPSALTATTQQTVTKKYGAGAAQMTSPTGTVSYVALPPGGTKWTVCVWRATGGAFSSYIVTSANKAASQAYVGGLLLGGETTPWLTVTTATGTVKLDVEAGITTQYDDLVVLPYDVPTDWPGQIVGYGAAFSQLATLDVDGDFIENNVGTKRIVADVTSMPVVKARIAGVTYKAVQSVAVDFVEV